MEKSFFVCQPKQPLPSPFPETLEAMTFSAFAGIRTVRNILKSKLAKTILEPFLANKGVGERGERFLVFPCHSLSAYQEVLRAWAIESPHDRLTVGQTATVGSLPERFVMTDNEKKHELAWVLNTRTLVDHALFQPTFRDREPSRRSERVKTKLPASPFVTRALEIIQTSELPEVDRQNMMAALESNAANPQPLIVIFKKIRYLIVPKEQWSGPLPSYSRKKNLNKAWPNFFHGYVGGQTYIFIRLAKQEQRDKPG